jgi:protein-tyrosine phosphatase
MAGFVDLHCHWLPAIDDGARDLGESVEMLRALADIGFTHVAATPHMRPQLFNNSPEEILACYRQTETALAVLPDLPARSLGSEHFYEPIVVERLLGGQGLPYQSEAGPRPRGAFLIEFSDLMPLQAIRQMVVTFRTAQMTPVIAHPERYRSVWERPQILLDLLDLGAASLLDVSAVIGKYGRQAERCAKTLLEMDAYNAGCSDSHRVEDVRDCAAGMRWLESTYGRESLEGWLCEAPTRLLHE